MTRSQRRLWVLFPAVPVLLLVGGTLWGVGMRELEPDFGFAADDGPFLFGNEAALPKAIGGPA